MATNEHQTLDSETLKKLIFLYVNAKRKVFLILDKKMRQIGPELA